MAADTKSTGRGVPGAQRLPVHLRLRGEHLLEAEQGLLYAGSPPPSRRAPPRREHRADLERFTSAFAESTASSRGSSGTSTVYLRLRREHLPDRQGHDLGLGSPPPSRRAPSCEIVMSTSGRFTSAFAESTRSRRAPRRAPAVHLRLRGEHIPSMIPSVV